MITKRKTKTERISKAQFLLKKRVKPNLVTTGNTAINDNYLWIGPVVFNTPLSSNGAIIFYEEQAVTNNSFFFFFFF